MTSELPKISVAETLAGKIVALKPGACQRRRRENARIC